MDTCSFATKERIYGLNDGWLCVKGLSYSLIGKKALIARLLSTLKAAVVNLVCTFSFMSSGLNLYTVINQQNKLLKPASFTTEEDI